MKKRDCSVGFVIGGKVKQKRRGLSPLLAGVQGFEPQLTDPESAVLPLNDTPSSLRTLYAFARTIIP
jgi:hypothetical protein